MADEGELEVSMLLVNFFLPTHVILSFLSLFSPIGIRYVILSLENGCFWGNRGIFTKSTKEGLGTVHKCIRLHVDRCELTCKLKLSKVCHYQPQNVLLV